MSKSENKSDNNNENNKNSKIDNIKTNKYKCQDLLIRLPLTGLNFPNFLKLC